jgi:hypothetical protein
LDGINLLSQYKQLLSTSCKGHNAKVRCCPWALLKAVIKRDAAVFLMTGLAILKPVVRRRRVDCQASFYFLRLDELSSDDLLQTDKKRESAVYATTPDFNSVCFFRPTLMRKTREKLILKQLDLSACKLLSEQERDEEHG